MRKALCQARAALIRAGFDGERGDEAELVLAEALNNVVEHAYADAPEGQILLQIHADAQRAVLQIRDSGHEMPGGVPPAGRFEIGSDHATLSEGGYGWHLIRRLSETVCYRRCGSTNCLELRLGGGRRDAAN